MGDPGTLTVAEPQKLTLSQFMKNIHSKKELVYALQTKGKCQSRFSHSPRFLARPDALA